MRVPAVAAAAAADPPDALRDRSLVARPAGRAPQYWSHRVTALEASISVNVFSDTAELLAYYRTQMRSLETLMPFLKNGPQVPPLRVCPRW